jgi:hypothetical protein
MWPSTGGPLSPDPEAVRAEVLAGIRSHNRMCYFFDGYNQKYGSAEAFAAGEAEAGAGDGQQQLLLPRQLDFGSNSSTAVSVPSMRVWLWRRHGSGRSLCKVQHVWFHHDRHSRKWYIAGSRCPRHVRSTCCCG